MADILQDVRALNENDDDDETEIKGLVKMLNPKYNPDWEEARFLGRGYCHSITDFLYITEPLRGCRLLRGITRPPHDIRRDMGELP